MKQLDLHGLVFGRLSVVSRCDPKTDGAIWWRCKCSCGATKEVRGADLKRGFVNSCGCLRRELPKERQTHGGSNTRLYRIWQAMRDRTSNPRASRYSYYGGRGISVCDEWQTFETFREWAISNGYDSKLSIDRINNNGNYEPGNCRWANQQTQTKNRRTKTEMERNKTMNTFKKVSAQGEITTDVIDKLPEGATLRKVKPVNGRLVISHSEQGHDHYIPAADAELLERTDNVPTGMQIFYSIVKNPTALKQSAAVPHAEIALEAKIYRHRISREFDPFEEQARRVAD